MQKVKDILQETEPELLVVIYKNGFIIKAAAAADLLEENPAYLQSDVLKKKTYPKRINLYISNQ